MSDSDSRHFAGTTESRGKERLQMRRQQKTRWGLCSRDVALYFVPDTTAAIGKARSPTHCNGFKQNLTLRE